jgi:hypothetical protein
MPDIEDLIRGYRPLPPPADLRNRVINHQHRSRRGWLLVAASALLALACDLMAAREHAVLRDAILGAPVNHDQQVRALASKLGNDEAAMIEAELILNLDEQETTAR